MRSTSVVTAGHGICGQARRTAALPVVALLAFFGSGCAGPTLDPRLAAAVDDDSIEAPISHLFGISDVSSAGFSEMQQRAEESIRDCMAVRGFVYIPVSSPSLIVDDGDELPPEDSLEYVERFGYGAAVAAEQELATVDGGTDPVADDPNDELRDQLSGPERDAYERALNGMDRSEVTWRERDGAPLDPATGEVMAEADFLTKASTGCAYQAYFSEEAQTARAAADLFASDLYTDLQARIASDPELVDLIGNWSRCMDGEGYAYDSAQDARAEFQAGAEAILGEVTASSPSTRQQAGRKLTELRRREIAVARADWNCSQELFERAPAITRRYEVEFIEQHEAVLLGLLDRYRP